MISVLFVKGDLLMHSLPPEGFSSFSHINLNSFAARFSLTLGLVLLLGMFYDCVSYWTASLLFPLPLRKHAYSNTLKILPPKNGNFSDKKF